MTANPKFSAPPKKKWHERVSRSGYFVGAVLLHLMVFILVATLVIFPANRPPPNVEFQAVKIQAPPPPPPPPVHAESTAANPLEPQVDSAPPPTAVSVLHTTSSSSFNVDSTKVVLPDLHATLSDAAGLGLAGSTGTGTGGGGGGGGMIDFGTPHGVGLVGYLYDLKQTPDGQPTEMAETPYETAHPTGLDPHWHKLPQTKAGVVALRSFITDWDMSDLDGTYYKSPTPLIASQICIPEMLSVNAPKAFNVEGKVAARRWIVVYTAKILPPDTGRYRFIGAGDDFLVVNVDGQNVLDATVPGEGEELDPSANVKENVGRSTIGQKLICGQWFTAQVGLSMQMHVLIGEGPGGGSGFILMIQKEDDGSPVGDYPIFQLHDVPIPVFSGMPLFTKKTIFQAAD
jgi:hypothetical protein